MLKAMLRFILIVLIIAMITSAVVLVIGLIRKWNTSLQFSNGFFYGGGVILVVGLINAMGARTDNRNPGMQDGRISTEERQSSYQLIRDDMAKGNMRMAYLGVAGLLLWGIAALIPVIWN